MIKYTHSELLFNKCKIEKKLLETPITMSHNFFNFDEDVIRPYKKFQKLYLN